MQMPTRFKNGQAVQGSRPAGPHCRQLDAFPPSGLPQEPSGGAGPSYELRSFPVSTRLPSGCSSDLFLAAHPTLSSEGPGGTPWRGKGWAAWVSL